MIAALLWIALGGWTEVKGNGFTVQMQGEPAVKIEQVTWATTGQMNVASWTSRAATGDLQLDVLSCYESGVEAPRMIGLMHDTFCSEDAPGQRRFDRTDPKTQHV